MDVESLSLFCPLEGLYKKFGSHRCFLKEFVPDDSGWSCMTFDPNNMFWSGLLLYEQVWLQMFFVSKS